MKPTRSANIRRSDPRLVPTLVLLACLCALPGRAAERQRPGLHPLQTHVTAAYAPDGSIAAVVDAGVPWETLVFARDGGRFRSTLLVTVVAERGGERVGGGVGRAEAAADDYAGTLREERLHCRVRVPLDGAEPVRLRLVARVEGTSREWRTVLDFDPGAGSAVPWTFADFAWNVPDTGGDAGFLDAATDTLVMDVVLLRRPGAADHPTTLHLIAGDGAGGERVLQRRPLGEAAGRDSLRLRLAVPGDAVPFGLVSIGLRLTAGEDGYLALVPERELTNLRVGWRDDESWRRHAGWLEGLVGGDDRRALGELPPARRRAAWDSLWAARPADAHPTEREHLLRIVEADRRFGEFGRGALSDRGRIYVLQGPPDRTESRILDLSYPGEWEVWYYRRAGVLYRFYDAYGVGDYRLYDTAPY